MELSVAEESLPIRGSFAISRGAKTEALVVVVTIRDGQYRGRGECVPYSRYGETDESVQKQIESARSVVEKGITKEELQTALPAGAARNALDCALWDLDCKRQRKTIWELVGVESKPLPISFTIGLGEPDIMAEKAREASKTYSLLKIKLGGYGDDERLRKIREATPRGRLIVDVNEGWNEQTLKTMLPICESVGVQLIEQPVPAEHSNVLQNIRTKIAICADESAHTSADISKLMGRYTAVNIKLDKTGGLTEALAMTKKARENEFKVMVGCMVSTSLSIAPATVVAQYADYVDLDGPLLLQRGFKPSIKYNAGMVYPARPELWG